jgi:SpoVK/Ycf46/Vps4 family AAA+-type ATPase
MPTLLREFERMDNICILATNRGHCLDEALDRRILHKLEFEIPNVAQRAEIWRRHLPPEAPVVGDIDFVTLGEEFEFSGGYIKNAVLTAAATAMCRPKATQRIAQEDLRNAALSQRRNKLSSCSDKLLPTVSLQDVILGPETRMHVDEFLCAARNTRTVMSSWGFGQKASRGNGIVALFSGPPGVGKTLTAEAIAGELGKSLQLVRLDAIVSKFVGDTAKNISSLFRSARDGDALLFIDEADALLGSRLDAGDHHSRYINQEVNVLLSEMELFKGVLVLATNRPGDIDSAFERRIQFHVRFPAPDRDARAAIWRALIPQQAPIASDVNLDELADRFAFSGGAIRNIILKAAYAAAGNGQVITQSMLLAGAARQEPLRQELDIGFGQKEC